MILGSATIDAFALGLYLGSAGLFLVEVIGMSPSTVGVVLGVGGAASMLGAVPIARLTEHFDGARVLAGLFLARGGAFLAFAAVRDPVAAAVPPRPRSDRRIFVSGRSVGFRPHCADE